MMKVKKFEELQSNNSLLTDQEWVDLVNKFIKYFRKHLRIGQSYMVALNDIRPDLYNKISGTDNDPFYDDDKLLNFIKFLNGEI